MDGEVAALRHVRDIWQLALDGEHNFRTSELAIGALLVTRRRYIVAGQHVTIPGHIGILTATGPIPRFIHASPSAGRVEERPLKTLETMIGCIDTDL